VRAGKPGQATHWPVLEGLQSVGLQQEIGTGAGRRAIHHTVALLVVLLGPPNIAAVIGGQDHGADGRRPAVTIRHQVAVVPTVYANVAEVALGLQPVARGKESIFHQILFRAF